MNINIAHIEREVYSKCGLEIADFKIELESQEYDACQFNLSGCQIISRSAKITPKKKGQFVTFWKRYENGPIEPFNESDNIDFFVVNVKDDGRLGQFVFPKSLLVKKGVLTTSKKEGKRAIRVYPGWDEVASKQANQTQKWQLNYFYQITPEIDFRAVLDLYGLK
ncbi:MepB family protein [uncultured Cyclobacterium sp.]|uniref:MepB family protein n=1 Tax=uncultured Cyclobacterium sp. TaxID=453820 RepID=UPI0030EE8BC5|tara:strand:- start:33315 stop:33809 length:495 start_codon:yes stop_codon:yes gene_type:complete